MAFCKPAALSILLLVSAAAEADAVIDRIVAESAKSAPVAFERVTRAEVRADPQKEPALVVDRYQPKAGTAGNWTVVSVDGRKPTPKDLETHAKNNSSPAPGFHNLHRMMASPPARVTEKDGKTIYLWTSLPKGTVITPGGDISSNLSLETTVEEVGGKPLTSEVRIFAAKPFRVKVVASINRFNVVSHYKPGANGTPFLVSQTAETDVSAPMGLGGKRKSIATFKPLGD